MNTDKSDAASGEKQEPLSTAYLSPLAVIALSFGYAVGWGSFAMPGTTFLPNAGPAGTIIGLLIGTVAIVVLAFNFHKVITSVPGGGGIYGLVTKIFGRNHGFLVGWFLFLAYLAIMWANSTALVLLVRYIFGDAFQFGFHYTMVGFDVYFGEVLLSLAAIVLCGCVCVLGKRTAVGLHTFFAFMLAAGVVVCFLAALFGHKGGWGSMTPMFAADAPAGIQVLRILALVPWAFVGFEAVVQSSSDFRFPVRKTFPLLLAAILISLLVYILLVILPILAVPEGYSNWQEYIAALPNLSGIASIPVFAAAEKALGPLGLALIGGSMLSALLTALFATYIAVSHLICEMADDDMIPKWLGKCDRKGTPVFAVLAVMCISLPIPFLGRTVIVWPVDLSNLGAAIAYGYASAGVLALQKKQPGGRLAEKAAGVFGLFMAIVFSLLMLVPNYLSGSSLSTESYLLLPIWCFGGFLIYRRAFILDDRGRLGKSPVVWITVLIMIFFSSLMWFRLAVCDSAEHAFGQLVDRTVTAEEAQKSVVYVNRDMLLKSAIELSILGASLSIILNLFSILHKREKNLIVEKLKAEKSASKSKSFFFSTISHDIRTPLNAIIGYTQALKLGVNQEEERQQALNSIMIGGRSLLRLISDAIDLAKLEDGRLEFERKPVNCAELLRRFEDSFRRTKPIQSIEFRCRSGNMPTVLIDPKRIRQILFHLADNAVKFTRHGFVEIRLSFEQAPGADTGTLQLEVEDTGCGISPEDMKIIASPYVQVDSEMARHGGTGLGLAVCRKLSEVMGGKLDIASVPGKGSTFTVTLPGIEVTDAAPVEEEEETIPVPDTVRTNVPQAQPAAEADREKPDVNAPSRRVLIVDDQKVNLIVLKTILKKLGSFDIVMAADGQEALEILNSAETPFDLVLTDMWMPIMDGEGLVHAIRADRRLTALPVHVVTADTEMPEKFRAIGFDGILLKPVSVKKLKEILG